MFRLFYIFIVFFVAVYGGAAHAQVVPTFAQAFSPTTIATGSVSRVTFTITNPNATVVNTLAFTDTLPAAVTIAPVPNTVTTCTNATVTAPAGGGTITFGGDGSAGGASVGGNANCTVAVDVTSGTVGVHENTTGDLTSSAGNSGTATASLTVASDRPGFAKAFSPTTVAFGATVPLTFTIDNTAGPNLTFLSFSDTLPTGMTVGTPSGSVTTCGEASATTTLTASSGSSTVSFSSSGIDFAGFRALAAGGTCTVTVNVVAGAVGTLTNVSGELSSDAGSSGFASAELTVTAPSSAGVTLTKQFLSSTVAPGSIIDVRFTLLNPDSSFAATVIGFSDDLGAMLTGAVATALPADGFCGAGSTITGTSVLTISGGALAARADCAFTVSVQVPGAAPDGTVTNTTSATSASINGSTVAGDPAAAQFTVDSTVPVLTKSFINDPVAAGTTATLQYTITNTSGASTIDDLAFLDPVDRDLPITSGDVTFGGTGTCTGTVGGVDVGGRFNISYSGGSLVPGSSCVFTVDIAIAVGSPPGSYASTSGEISGTVGGSGITGPGATDTLVITGPVLSVALTKSFTDDPILPGGTVTLQFSLTNTTDGTALTDLGFTDDLNAMLTGATAIALPADGFCGAGSTLTGTTLITMAAGSLAVAGNCTFSVSVLVPGGAAVANYTNTTSDVSGDAGAGIETAAGSAATDTLVVSDVLAVTAVKSFTDDPVLPGDTVTLEFTLTNPNAGFAASAISFSDDVNGALTGLVSISGTVPDVCGVGSQITGTTFLSFTGGSIPAASPCTFSVTLQVPAGATPGTYGNTTSNIISTVDGAGRVADPATDALTVASPIENLILTKSFTDDPVLPGDPVTLQFTLDNTTGASALSAIGFTDDLGAMLAGATAIALPADNFCGTGSTMTGTSTLTISGASLAAGGICTFSATVQVPGGAVPGSHTNTTSTVAVTSGAFSGTVGAATDQLSVSPSNVTLIKSFTDDPVLPGETVTLEFSILNPAAGGTLSDIRFSDNLDAALTGLVATGLPQSNVCGTGSSLTGTSTIALTGGALAPGGSCNLSITLQVPASAPPGTHVNTTSPVTEGVVEIASAVSDSLVITSPVSNLAFSKVFTDDPVFSGGTATLQFNITNPDATSSVTAIGFTDDLNAMLSGATAVSLPAGGFCGAGSTLSGTSSLAMSGGNLAPGASCAFTVGVQVPGATAAGNFVNTTSVLAGTVNGVAGTAGTASDTLVVVAAPTLAVTPATDFDSSGPIGGPFSPVSLSYTLENQGTVGLSYTAADDQAFIDVSPASGTIAAGGTATVTVSFNAAANALAVGVHSGIVTFTNLSNASATTTRAVNLTVEALGSLTIVQTSLAGDGTFTFSSPTPALSLSLTTANGTATSGAISLVGGTYQVTQTPPDDGYGLAAASCNDSDSSIDLSTRVATIVLAPGEAVVCTFDSVNARGRTVEVINRFLHRRADLILSSEPDNGRRINRLKNQNGGASGSGAPFEFSMTAPGSVFATFETSVSQIRAAYAAQDSTKAALLATSGAFANTNADSPPPEAQWDFWISAQVTKFNDDTGGDGDGLFGILYVGGDYKVNSSLLIGALAQFDYLDQQWNDLSASASGTGWMAGPYATVRITDNLFLDTRAAWGMSSNDISPFNTYTDNFETTRWLLRGELVGDWQFGDFNFRPSASIAYMQEAQDAYVDTLNVAIPGQTVSLGQVNFGPSFSYRYTTAEGLILEPSASLTGIWNFSADTSGATTTTTSAAIDFRAKAEVGLTVRARNGISLQATGSYDGLGVDNYDAVSGRMVLSIPFN